MDGGSGNDTLNGDLGDDVLFGGIGNDVLKGQDGDDVLHGGDGADILKGNVHSDTLFGEAGDDELRGGNGADTLVGGAGDDDLYGGAGIDTFVFASNDGSDTIFGYEDNKDKFDFSGFGFATKAEALSHFYEIGSASNDVVGFVFDGMTIRVEGADLGDITGSDIII